ncbi:unnamed protein product [Blepharisma stoltei]|uniref:NAD(+) ADP-ribosyltransferase n=1 Tax=Blepharisma stoltei TaxID=1481888 RepID=A0AAU9JJ88_9CILI|nr:unnamed protein product [Blepharisma stoltei]
MKFFDKMQALENEEFIKNDNNLSNSLEELSSFRELIKSDPQFINLRDSRLGSTPLISSVISNNFKKIEFLLLSGANPNIPNDLGETPLHIAADNFDYQTAKILLKYSADPKIANLEGETPLHNATYRGDDKIVNLLLQNDADPNSLTTQLGQSPLHIAASNGHLEIIKLLLSHGADPDIKDKQGDSALNLAKNKKIKQILQDWSEEVKYDANTGLWEIREARPSEEDISSRLSLQLQSSISSAVMSPTEKVQSTSLSPFDKHLKSCGTADTTLRMNQGSTSLPGSHEISINAKDNDKLYQFLTNIKLDIYFPNLVNAGFDDFESLISQMNTPLPITADMLDRTGITKPGHQKRILIMIEKVKNSPDDFFNNWNVDENVLTESIWWKCCIFQQTERANLSLKDMLESLNLSFLLENFYEVGYEELEFLVEQMSSELVITDKLLKEEIGIKEPKHRKVILKKLKNISKQTKKSHLQASINCCVF